MLQNLRNLAKNSKFRLDNLVDLKMLKNAYFLAKIGADTAENEQHFAEFWDPYLSPLSPGKCSLSNRTGTPGLGR